MRNQQKAYKQERSALEKLKDIAEDCEAEKVATPGSIQPHGLLLVLSAQKLEILQLSDNTQKILGR